MTKLKGDKNAWVGLQIQTQTLEDAKPIPNVTEAKLRAGPYGKPIMDPNHPDLVAARTRIVSSVPVGLTPIRTVDEMMKTDASKASLAARKQRAKTDLLERAAANKAKREAEKAKKEKTVLRRKERKKGNVPAGGPQGGLDGAGQVWYEALGMRDGELPDTATAVGALAGGGSLAWGGEGSCVDGVIGGQFSLLGGGSDSLVGSPIKPSEIMAMEGGGYGGSSWASGVESSSSSAAMESGGGSSSRSKTGGTPGGRRGLLPPGVYAATPVRGDKPLSSAHKRAIACAVNGSIPQGVFVHHSKEMQKSSVAATVNALEVYGHGEGGMGLSFMRTDGKAHRDEIHKAALMGKDPLPEFNKEKADRVAGHIDGQLALRRSEDEAAKLERSLGQSFSQSGSGVEGEASGGGEGAFYTAIRGTEGEGKVGGSFLTEGTAVEAVGAMVMETVDGGGGGGGGGSITASIKSGGVGSVNVSVATTSTDGKASFPMRAPQDRERISLAWRTSPWGRLKVPCIILAIIIPVQAFHTIPDRNKL
jgi:hypothetical protein